MVQHDYLVYYDIRARSQDLYVHIFATALVIVFNVFGLVLYLILRPRETLAEAYERSLEEETLLQEIEERQSCPNCRQRVQSDFMYCPYCQTELKQRCRAAIVALAEVGSLPVLREHFPAPFPYTGDS